MTVHIFPSASNALHRTSKSSSFSAFISGCRSVFDFIFPSASNALLLTCKSSSSVFDTIFLSASAALFLTCKSSSFSALISNCRAVSDFILPSASAALLRTSVSSSFSALISGCTAVSDLIFPSALTALHRTSEFSSFRTSTIILIPVPSILPRLSIEFLLSGSYLESILSASKVHSFSFIFSLALFTHFEARKSSSFESIESANSSIKSESSISEANITISSHFG